MLNAFQPQGNSILINGTTTATAGQQPSTGSIQGLRVASIAAVPVYLAIGTSTVQASIPTTSTPANGICIPPGGAETFTVPPNCYLSAITSSGTGSLFVTPGFGV